MAHLEILVADGAVRIPRILPEEYRCILREDALQRIQKCNTPVLDNGISATLAVSMDVHSPLVMIGALILDCMGVPDVRYLAGAIIPKYAGEPERPWHVDWWDWESPETKWALGPQLGIIFYLDDANAVTGNLQIVPGSHRKRGEGQTFYSLDCYADAGEAIVLDARTEHAVTRSYPALDKQYRIAITLWYLTQWEKLSEQVKASSMLCVDQQTKIALSPYGLIPDYSGNVLPRAHNTKRP